MSDIARIKAASFHYSCITMREREKNSRASEEGKSIVSAATTAAEWAREIEKAPNERERAGLAVFKYLARLMRRSFQEISHKDNKILPGSDSGPLCDPSRIRTDAERARGANGSSPSRSLSHSLSLSLSAECSNALLSSLSPLSFYASPCPLPHSLSLSLSRLGILFTYFPFAPLSARATAPLLCLPLPAAALELTTS